MKGIQKRLSALLLSAAALALPGIAGAEGAENASEEAKLKNGSFEEGQTWLKPTIQCDQSKVPAWSTTAFDGRIELFTKNKGVYIGNVTLEPTDGTYAAELNADEESTLYQIVKTEPSSLYEWGLDHGARTTKDEMALIIGPAQDVSPSKNQGIDSQGTPSQKYGRDQFMQMVDWLKKQTEIQNEIKIEGNSGIARDGKALILYSKKFAKEGGFEDNADGQPFSLKPNEVYTEEWHIWLMADSRAYSGVNPWGSYGANKSASENGSGSGDKYYLYNVPTGQERTIFAFVSVSTSTEENKGITFGNFLDRINFKLYRSLSGSTTPHGSAIIKSSSGGSGGTGGSEGHSVTADGTVSAYVPDGEPLTICAEIAAADKATVTFAGIYYTYSTKNGSKTEYIPNDCNDENPKWILIPGGEGNPDTYQYTLPAVNSAISIHFVFIKSPVITYDVNGGDPYNCGNGLNYYDFKPNADVNPIEYIAPYTSYKPTAADGWAFRGWLLTDGNGKEQLLKEEHSIACNYKTGETHAQNFIVVNQNVLFGKSIDTAGVTWTPPEGVTPFTYNAPGLTMIAQWRWKQTFIPKVRQGDYYVCSPKGGTVTISKDWLSKESADNESGPQGQECYYAKENEIMTVTATPEDGYTFEGWYDKSNTQLIDTKQTISYTVGKGSVNTLVARFSNQIKQTYIRQIQEDDGTWKNLPNDDTQVPALSHTEISVPVGTYVSSTATNNAQYAFIGWFDEQGNKVNDNMVLSDGKTIAYSVTEVATYYARYQIAVEVKFEVDFDDQGGTVKEPVSPEEYGVVSINSVFAAPGDIVTCTAYAKTGYKFTKWINENGGEVYTNTIFSVHAPNSGTATYKAVFTARDDTKYTVNHRFTGWDPTNPGDSPIVESKIEKGKTGASVTPDLADLSKESYVGYVYSSGQVTKEILPGGNLVFNIYYTKTDTELVYKANAPLTHTATGTVDPSKGYVGWPVNVSPNAFEVEGYTFTGWNTQEDGKGTKYNSGDDYPLLANVDNANPNKLYAQWKANTDTEYTVEHYKLSADKSQATKVEADTQTLYGTTDTEVDATNQQKSYPGYTYDAEKSEGTVKGVIRGDGSLVLKLYYAPNATTLTYKPNYTGGPENEVRTGLHVDEKVTLEGELFTRAGYTFTGWNTQADGKGTEYNSGDDYILLANDGNANPNVLYAQWAANTDTKYTVEHYKLSADKSQATKVDADTQTLYGMTDTEVDAGEQKKSYPGYTYDAGKSAGTVKGIISGDGALVLKLYYAPDETTLTYKPNYDCSDPDVVENNLHVDETVTLAGDLFTRAGYTLTGWNTQASGGGRAFMKGAQYTMLPNANSVNPNVLYAQWAANTTTPYTVEHHKLNSRGEVVSSEVEHLTGTTDTTVEAVVKYYPGYLMDPNHAEHKKEGVVTADGKLVLRLFYVPQSAVLIYKPNGGVGADVTQAGHVHEGVTIRKNPFLRVGYAFTGWNTLPDGSGTAYAPGGEILLVEGELILYAQWESVPPVITPEDADLPKTGDRTHLTVWLLLLAASSSLLLALVLSGGKRGRAAGGRCAAGQSRREDAT